ncbi:hypothetical protein EX895_000216 [Sporisorium graminicola]|uniref:MI domain-containing protein n=1 Tax=Sporisorium graminicola TaxID=280036 RepID=A0A4U7L2X2_9BASI|nr:hypothetical protein EX895_000216 [Sporisorium graminicola]TKY90218.1 hypothetical protein EX895_000216 [Sporisorium graminicola]
MPFDPRTKSRKTTTLPASLRDELGLPAPSAHRRPFRPQDRGANRFNSHTGSGISQLKAIGRPQSALNGAAKGTPRGPIKSLRNQEKEQQEQRQQQQQQQRSQPRTAPQHKRPHQSKDAAGAHASSSRQPQRAAEISQQKRKSEKQPEAALKVIKKPKSSKNNDNSEALEQKTRLNPFTGEMELVKSTAKKSSSSKPTALEKMLARAEAGPSSSSKGKARATDALAGAGKKKSRRHMNQQEKEEEDEIRWLEYSLGKSREGQDVVRDDLDDFLDDLDRFQVGMYDESGSENDEQSEEESDDSGLEEVTASESEGDEEEEEEEEREGESESASEGGGDEVDVSPEEGMYDFDSNDEDDFSNWDAAMATTDEEDEDAENDGADASTSEDDVDDDDDSEAEEAHALIAGLSNASPSESAAPASTTTAATSTSKYIPPALRAKLTAEASTSKTPSSTQSVTDLDMDPLAAQKLRRQAQGLLNRLGDGNIDTIVGEYESLYRTHARAHVTTTITQLILDTVTSRSNLIDTFVILHAALVAALHKVVGVEFAAFFVQRLVEELTKHYTALKEGGNGARKAAEEEEEEVKGKECLNLTVLACELYNLHVVACPLIYDLIRMFLGQQPGAASDTDAAAPTATGSVGEVDIELLLKTIRSCGHQLRTDDSSSLKSIISLTQSRVASSTSATSTRTKFMLERMSDLQKTKTKAIGNDASNPNSAAGQLLTRMKKYLGGMGKKRTVKSYEALRIGLKDLQDADKKGKWWLVGAAWTGQTDQSDAQGLTKLLPMNARASAIQSATTSAATQHNEQDEQQARLLELAREQGMNTDARRIVFVTLLTAEDYRQAAENVLLLKLNDVQRREVIRVLVHCVGSENVYNPYYTLIGQEICRNDYGMRITLQYCLWDFLREIGQKQVGGEKFAAALFSTEDDDDDEQGKRVDPRRVANMARAYAWWISHDCLSLQALKTVDFTALNPRPAHFLGLLLIHLILSIQSPKSPAKTLHLPTVTAPLKHDKLAKMVQSNLVGGSIDLTRGLLFFLNTKLDSRAQKQLILGAEAKGKTKELKDSMRPLLETVKEGLGVVVKTVEGIVQQHDGVGQIEDGGEMDLGHASSEDEEDDF